MNHQKTSTTNHADVVTSMFANMGLEPNIINSDAPSVKGDGLAF